MKEKISAVAISAFHANFSDFGASDDIGKGTE